jgi:hypothetical protein
MILICYDGSDDAWPAGEHAAQPFAGKIDARGIREERTV